MEFKLCVQMIIIKKKEQKMVTFTRDDKDDETRLNKRVRITEEMRVALAECRVSRKLSYARMALLLDVHWSTYRKWEKGETKWYTRQFDMNARKLIELGDDNPLLEELKLDRDVTTMDIGVEQEARLERLLRQSKSMWRICGRDFAARLKFLHNLEASLDDFMRIVSRNRHQVS